MPVAVLRAVRGFRCKSLATKRQKQKRQNFNVQDPAFQWHGADVTYQGDDEWIENRPRYGPLNTQCFCQGMRSTRTPYPNSL